MKRVCLFVCAYYYWKGNKLKNDQFTPKQGLLWRWISILLPCVSFSFLIKHITLYYTVIVWFSRKPFHTILVLQCNNISFLRQPYHTKSMDFGVPQGLVLRPMLLILFSMRSPFHAFSACVVLSYTHFRIRLYPHQADKAVCWTYKALDGLQQNQT